MSIGIGNLTRKKADLPPRILIYGPPGLGKTSFAGEFPDAIFIQTEDGTPGDMELTSFTDGAMTEYGQVLDAIASAIQDPHDFKTLAVDSLDRLEALIVKQACADNDWKSVEDPGFGKGYVMLENYWREFYEGLRVLRQNRRMNIVLIAHSTIGRFDSPTSPPYSRYDIRLHKGALAMVQDEVDAILFVNQDATIKTEEGGFNKKTHRAEGGAITWIYAKGRPAYVAKNRYGIPDKLMFNKGTGYSQIAPFLPGQPAQPEPAPKAPAKRSTAKAQAPEAAEEAAA